MQNTKVTTTSFRRMNSSPFARKPIPFTAEDYGGTSNGNNSHEGNNGSVLSDKCKTASDYKSFDEDGESTRSLQRHLSLYDAIAIGVGGTIGSGLFVLCGMVAHDYAGPATALSWAISSVAALLSGCCYAELSARIPLSGSAYAYTYVAMGELPAVLAAACLSLEFLAAAAAVARSWGDKIVVWLSEELDEDNWLNAHLTVDGVWSPFALLISCATVLLLLNGVKESKCVANFFTIMKVCLVLFMVVVGFVYVRPTNWTPFIPPELGVKGILRGAMSTFFGYIGYDEVCSLGGEVQNPKQNLPRSILVTLAIVSVLYVLSSLALTGMQPYADISSVSGFPGAFRDNNALFAAHLTAIGEILTLPIVVLIGTMAQPRLQYAMAKDGLLPALFLELDEHGNLFKSTAVAGVLMILIATFVPFTHLNDMISCAVLCALSMTDTSLIILWHESPSNSPGLTERLLLVFHVASLATGVAATHFWNYSYGKVLLTLALCASIVSLCCLYMWCPKNTVFGGCHRWPKNICFSHDKSYFRTPLVPFLPCIAIFVNWYLISQLELSGICGLAAYLGLATAYYFFYAAEHSAKNRAEPLDGEVAPPTATDLGFSLRELTQVS